MGCDKATLNFRERPLWRHQLDTLRGLELTEIFISARELPDWQPNDIKFIQDNQPSRGPISGLAAALAAISTSHLLVLAIDMPFMSSGFLASLIEQVAVDCGVIPRIGDRFEPLAAIYPRDACADVEAVLATNEFALQTVARRLIENGKLRALDVSVSQRGLFRNLNDPADLHRLL